VVPIRGDDEPPIRALIPACLAARSDPDSAADSLPGSVVIPAHSGLRFLPSRRAVAGLRDFSRAAHGVEGRHSTPERVLHGNFRLPWANLLKAERLEEKSCQRVAVEQPEVRAGELVDS
jgi:hypothetical protein